MAVKLISYDKIEKLLGRNDFEEESTNRRDISAAKAVLRTAPKLELTERQRECVRLYFYENMTEEQTANELGDNEIYCVQALTKGKAQAWARSILRQQTLNILSK